MWRVAGLFFYHGGAHRIILPIKPTAKQVLVPYNFNAGKFEKTAAAHHAEKGIIVGAKMTLKRRITMDFHTKKKLRRDVGEGTEVSVKGFEGMNNVVVEVTAEFDKKPYTVDTSMKISNLQFPEEGDHRSRDESAGQILQSLPLPQPQDRWRHRGPKCGRRLGQPTTPYRCGVQG